MARRKATTVKDLQKLQGKLMHAAQCIPAGKGLLSPIVALVAKHNHRPRAHVTLNQATKQALHDWKLLLKTATKQPTPCADLVPAAPDYGGYCDASKAGAGGVWFGLQKDLPPLVWRIAFPKDIQDDMVSTANPNGRITNSDLEMTGLLCQWLVLERLADLEHTHIAVGCDNTPMVAWASKLLASKAQTAAHILRALALRMLACQASPLATFHIPGEANRMADLASRSFATYPDDRTFLTHFGSTFPLPQGASWLMCNLPSTTCGKVFSLLRTNASPLVWWQQTTNNASVIGGIGETSFGPISTRTFKTLREKNASLWCRFSLSGSGEETLAEEFKSALGPYKMRLQPSARPLNWTDTRTPSTSPSQQTTMFASSATLNPTAEMTHHQDLNSPSQWLSQTGSSDRPEHPNDTTSAQPENSASSHSTSSSAWASTPNQVQAENPGPNSSDYKMSSSTRTNTQSRSRSYRRTPTAPTL